MLKFLGVLAAIPGSFYLTVAILEWSFSLTPEVYAHPFFIFMVIAYTPIVWLILTFLALIFL